MGNKLIKKKRKKADFVEKAPSDEVNEKAVAPPPPPVKIEYKAQYDYEAVEDDELTISRGDIVYVFSEDTGGAWVLAKNKRTGKTGLIPEEYLVKVDSLETADYYFDIGREEAESLLQVMGNPTGTFLVRPSSVANTYALSIRVYENCIWLVRHYKVFQRDDKWFMNEAKMFKRLDELINYHKETCHIISVQLTVPLPRTPPDVPFKDFEVDRSNFIMGDVLGRGNFGEVKKAKWGQRAKGYVAIKIVQANKMSNEDFIQEAKIMHQLVHKNIVKLLAVCTQPPDADIYIITEFMTNGSLLDFLRSEKGEKKTFRDLMMLVSNITSGMSYLESKNFVHRDLRAANVLVDDAYIAKVADFGLTQLMEEEGSSENTQFPVRWTAPEAARERHFSTKSDVWSFGILLYEIVTYGVTPYLGLTNREVRKKVEEEGYRMANPNGENKRSKTCYCPQQIYETMLACWSSHPSNRPLFSSLSELFSDYLMVMEDKYD